MKVPHVMSRIIDMWSPSSSFVTILYSHSSLSPFLIAYLFHCMGCIHSDTSGMARKTGVRGLGAGRANEGTLPRIRQRWTAAETNSAGSVQGSVQVFELATWHGRGA
jgi:hypothetical protein